MLRYVDDSTAGITRRRKGRHWQYFDPKGARITDRAEIDRLNAIALPPAYRKCWFCPDPNGHIQAIGHDARGRRQYRYHPDFRAERDARKYDRLVEFGAALSKLRKQVKTDIAGKATSCETVIAAVIRLIDASHMRVGNEEYAKTNKSFGATTLRNRHARVGKDNVKITYPGKHGIRRSVTISDRNLARIARRTQDLPGQHLFEYLDDAGTPRPVGSADVNAYIRDAMGEAFTAKDFRTWGASVIAFAELARRADADRAIGIKTVIEPVAEALGNTPAISRKSYVHPALLEAAREAGALGDGALPRATKYLSAAERGLVDFLKRTNQPVVKPGKRS